LSDRPTDLDGRNRQQAQSGILGLVAEHQPKGRSEASFVYQRIPVEVAYFVSKMTKKGAIGFAK